ncbi:hypothetical protein EL17_22480 [Anditalea andensis]|uniref:histidine kinase n=2 Tax=Anditalea andensis TaxID=1048983 RepID=A0A074L5N0_9BACT|nr:hypothetical protein EL17_22480 [Anditalea andensis]
MLNLLGLNRKEHDGGQVKGILNKIDSPFQKSLLDGIYEIVQVVINTKSEQEISVPIHTKANTANKHLQIRVTPIYNATEKIEYLFLQMFDPANVLPDITAEIDPLERSEVGFIAKKMFFSHKDAHLLFNLDPLYKFIYHPDTLQIVEVNQPAIHALGYDYSEFFDMAVNELFVLNDNIDVFKNKKSKQTLNMELPILMTLQKKDGQLIKVSCTFNVINALHPAKILICQDVTDREAALAKLEDNETKLLAAQQLAKIGYWKVDLMTGDVFMSEEIYQIWQIDKNSVIDAPEAFLHYVHPDDRKAFSSRLSAAMEGNANKDFEHRIILNSGEIKWLYQKENLVTNSHGEIVLLEGTVQDITERKLAEEKLLKSEARHRGLVETQTHYVVRIDLNGNYTFINKKYEQDFGWVFNEDNSSDQRSFLSTKDYHHYRIREIIAQCLQNPNQVYKVELDKVTPNGGTIHTLWDFICLTDPDGKPVEFQSMGTDITSRIKIEKELQESKKRYEYVIQATSDAIWDWDLTEGTIFISTGFYNAFGYQADDFNMPNTSWFNFVHPNDMQRVIDSIDLVLKGEGLTWESEYRFKKANGIYTYIKDRGVIIRDTDGHAVRMVGAAHDITEEKATEREDKLKLGLRKVFSENLSLEKTYEKILMHIVGYRELPFGEIWVTNYEQNRLFRAAHFGSAIHIEDYEKINLNINQGLPGYVWQSKSYHIIHDLDESPIYIHKAFARKNGLKSAIAYPIIIQEQVVGVIVLYKNSDPTLDHGFSISQYIIDQIATDIQRKKAELELNLFFDLSPDFLCIASFDGYFKKINPSFEQALGYTHEEILKTPFIDLVHPDFKKNTYQTLAFLSSGQKVSYHETKYLTKNGNYIWLAWTSTPLEEDGLIFGIAKNITEKKEQESLLAASNKKIAETLESIRDGFFSLDKKWNITYWNNEAERIIGKKREEVLNQNFWKMFPETRDLAFHSRYEQALKEQEPSRFEAYYAPLELWLDTSVYPSGQGLTIYFKDITSKKIAELELVQFKKIIESSKECIGIIHSDKKTSYINPSFSSLMGYEEEEVKKVDNSLEYYADQAFATEVFQEIFSGHHWQGDIDLITKEGKTIHFYLSAGPIYNDKGELIAAFGIHTDISERKAVEKKLYQLNVNLTKQAKDLAFSNAELEQFAYVASHDLQEPLRMISSFLQQIEKKYNPLLDDKGRQYIHFAIDGAQRMKQIILDLLSYSRVGRMEESHENINLNELISEIKALLKKQTDDTQAIIDYERLPIIKSVKTPLRHLFLNIIENGLKYQAEGATPHIKISSKSLQNHWHFQVKDNGIGINPDYFEKIFIMFQRLHYKDQYSGSGMGLAICKKIVDYLGGDIWVESREGEGSTFNFTILKVLD